ncbi:MAG: radical SAM protein [Desulfosarcina sp.]|jgi:radical SAM superfamily enzyme YgiQ (UPF0313 family)
MIYRNVLCLYPYRVELKSVGFFPPIGLEYVASAIEDLVDTVTLIDLRHQDAKQLGRIYENTDLVLISHNWDCEQEHIKALINEIPDSNTVIVGGRFATEHVDELFKDIPRIDAIARGDGEELAREVVQNGISTAVDGLSFKSNGRVVHNKNRQLEPVRSDFFPNRKLRRNKYTVTLDKFTSDIEIDLMLGSRGCPYNCKFCDFKFNPLGEKRKWSVRTPESIVAELKTIDANVVGFADDIFSADMNWVEKLCDLLIKEGVRKKYVINARLEIAKRPDVLKKMYQAGFMVFLMGVESAHDKTLASMGKGFTTETVKEYFRVFSHFNFVYHCYFIIGNIGESREEMLDIVTFAHELGVDTPGLSVLRATKYSPLRKMLDDLDDYHIEEHSGKVYSDALSVDDLQQIRRDVNASFFKVTVILRLLKKMIIHRLLTFERVNQIILYAARRKVKKMAKKRAIRMGRVVR